MSDPKNPQQTQIMLEVPHQVIDAQVRAAVFAALSKDPTKLVQAIVDQALRAKDLDNYHNRDQTIFQHQTEQLVREVAQEEFKKFLEEQRPEIAKQIRAALGKNTKGLVEKIAEKCAAAVLKLDVQAWVGRE